MAPFNHNQPPTVAALEARQDSLEKAIDLLSKTISEMGRIQSDLSLAIGLLQQAQDQVQKACNDCSLDIREIKSNQASLKGGWLALCALGAALVGLAGIVGALSAWLSLKHQ